MPAQAEASSRFHNCARLAALRATGLVDEPTRDALDRLTRVAEPWATARGTPLSHSFCKHVVEMDAPLVVGRKAKV
jgi:hypothetical protein